MKSPIILSFDAADPRIEIVGGKGLNLCRLSRAGMPVPPGFVLTTAAYGAFVQANALDGVIAEALGLANGEAASR